jgi:hypothetical protein
MKLYIDTTARRLVISPTSTAPLAGTTLFRNDETDMEIYFMRQTGQSASPLEYIDKSSATVKMAVGDADGIPASGTWVLDGATLDFDATATDVQTALRTSQSDNALTVTGTMQDGFTVTWGAVGAEDLLAADITNLLPECSISIGERRAGSASVKEQQFIRVKTLPAAYQSTFTALDTDVTATIAEVQSGSATVSEIQRITFDVVPISGQWTITMPQGTRSITAAVVAGVFTTTANHGFILNQEVVFTDLTNPANVANGTTYFVKATPSATTFTISATAGGAALTTATADAGTATVTTPAKTSDPILPTSTAAEIQSILEAMANVGTGNISVTGTISTSFLLLFQGAKGKAALPQVTVADSGLLAPEGFSGDFSLATYQLAEILGGAGSRKMLLEIQVEESGDVDTAAQLEVNISGDVIDNATLSAVPLATPIVQGGDATLVNLTVTGDLESVGVFSYDGKSVAIAANVLALPSDSNVVTVTGTSPINSFTGGDLGTVYYLVNGTGGALTLTHSATVFCRGSANLVLAATEAATIIVRSAGEVSVI